MNYWDGYYSRGSSAPLVPSQFAAFCANEFSEYSHIVDIGCGNGRDALFFSRCGFTVSGLDLSTEAIRLCEQRAQALPAESRPSFITGSLGMLVEEGTSVFQDESPPSALLYARFLVHAITVADEIRLIEGVVSYLRSLKAGGAFAVEFRTHRDSALSKETKPHFRRFVDPLSFASNCVSKGLRCVYHVEGFGYAKFRNDDAHVARMIFQL